METESFFKVTDWLLFLWKTSFSKVRVLKQLIIEHPQLKILDKPFFYRNMDVKGFSNLQKFIGSLGLIFIVVDLILIPLSLINKSLFSYEVPVSFVFFLIGGSAQYFLMPGIKKVKAQIKKVKTMSGLSNDVKEIIGKPLNLVGEYQYVMIVSIFAFLFPYTQLLILISGTAIESLLLYLVGGVVILLMIYSISVYLDYKERLEKYLDLALNRALELGVTIKATIFISNLNFPFEGNLVGFGKEIKFESQKYMTHTIKYEDISQILLNK